MQAVRVVIAVLGGALVLVTALSVVRALLNEALPVAI